MPVPAPSGGAAVGPPAPRPPRRTLGRARAAAWAALLSLLAVFNTLVVAGHNLGARDSVRFINGGKVFLASGAMWYHIPGLGQLDLAPQNFGGHANLRNNDVALLDRPLDRLDQMDLDLELAPGAYALVVLDHHDEGTFTALRLSALPDATTPLDSAWVRYEGGRQVAHLPLANGPVLAPGRFDVTVSLSTGTTVVDGVTTPMPDGVSDLRPAPAVGCGERDVTLHRWAVDGAAPGGQPVSLVEDWSLARWLPPHAAGLFMVALGLWTLLLGVPVWKASFEAGLPFDRVLTRSLLKPTPRLIYGLLCLCPWTPLLLQLVLITNYLLLAWMELVGAVARGGRRWRIPPDGRSGGSRRELAFALGLTLTVVGGAMVAAGATVRARSIGAPAVSPMAQGDLAWSRADGPLSLGAPLRMDVRRDPGPVAVSLALTLAPGEVARLDLLGQAPDDRDLFQVDRAVSNAPEPNAPEAPDAPAGPGGADDGGPAGHDFHGVSVVLSADPALPSETLRASGFEVERSPRPFTLKPGAHTVTVTVDLPLVQVAVDGRVVEVRDDLAQAFSGRAEGPAGWRRAPDDAGLGAVMVHAWSERVSRVADLRADAAQSTDPLSFARASARAGALWGVPGALLVLLGVGLLVITPTLGPGQGPRGAAQATARLLRAHGALLVVLLLLFSEHLSQGPGTGPLSLPRLMVAAAALAALNLFLLQRAQGRGRTLAAALALAHGLLVVEVAAPLWPGWRHRVTHWWTHGVAPAQWWAYDPMLRRLNPWFVDTRFQRRPVPVQAPAGRSRVIVFGGSQTYGWGIPSADRQAFSDRLEADLRERGRDVEVINASFPGVKSTVGLRWFEGNLRRYDADLIVINYVVNEFIDADPAGLWAGERDPDASVAPLVGLSLLRRTPPDVRNSHLVQVVLAHRYEVRELERSLREWTALARADGTPVVLCVEPTNLLVETGGREIMRNDADAGAAVETYRRLGAELGLPVYEPIDRFLQQPTDLLFYDTMHLSRRGHAVFAEGLAEVVDRALPAPPPSAGVEPPAP